MGFDCLKGTKSWDCVEGPKWVWLKIKQEGQTAGFGPCFHLPGLAPFWNSGFLSHSQVGKKPPLVHLVHQPSSEIPFWRCQFFGVKPDKGKGPHPKKGCPPPIDRRPHVKRRRFGRFSDTHFEANPNLTGARKNRFYSFHTRITQSREA